MKSMFGESIGSCGRILVFRIPTGDDLVQSILKHCSINCLNSGVLISCVGSLKQARYQWTKASTKTLRGSERSDLVSVQGPVELLSAHGMLGVDSPNGEMTGHFHATFCDEEGKMFGGHITEGGNIVHSTMDVVILEIAGIELARIYDPAIELPILMSKNVIQSDEEI